MAKRGTKPQPTALKLLKGAQPCRVNHEEPEPLPGIPEPPDFVEGKGLELWHELAPMLASMGILTLSDRHAFALLCESYQLLREFPRDRPRREEFRKLLAEFGLSPSSRSSLKVADKPKDDLADFLAEDERLMPRPPVPQAWIRGPVDLLAVEQGCYFDPSKGKRACDFIERFCKQSKGRWAGQPLRLVDWQRDFLMRLYGWRRADGTRRYRRFYVEIAKKNGKTTLLSGLALLELVDGDAGPEVFINACDRAQASMMFDESARMVRSSPDLKSRMQVVDSRKTITYPARNGVLRANSAEAPSKDGLNPSLTLFDELHRQPGRDLWEVFEYAGAARLQPLLGSITTAGEDESGIWHEQREYSEAVNRGDRPDIAHLGIVYRADPADDLDDPATWRKANPSLGVTIREQDFAAELEEAKDAPAKLANFKRLRLNIVARSTGLYLSPEVWAACGAAPAPVEDLWREPCYAGLDLSSTTDLTAFALAFGDPGRGFDVHCHFWLPGDDVLALERRDRQTYRAWADQGFLTLIDGPVVDYAFVRRDINRLVASLDLRKILIDPFNAQQLAAQLRDEDGLPVEFLRQGFLSLSGPTKELARLTLAGKLRHGNHPILRWNASNAVAEEDASGNVKLTKKRSRQKIDGMAALVNALAGAVAGGEEPSVYETERLLLL